MSRKSRFNVLERDQKQISTFFRQYARADSSKGPPAPSTQTAAAAPGNASQAKTESPQQALEMMKPARETTASPKPTSPKRIRDDSDDDYDDDTIVVRPLRKTPRMSQEPEPQIPSSQPRPVLPSSSLSTLKSDTPEAPEISATTHRSVPTTFGHPIINGRPSTSMSNTSLKSSFGSISSQRVVKNGELMVRNSDDEETDDSLEELEDILGTAKAKMRSMSPLSDLSPTPTLSRDVRLMGTRRSLRTNASGSGSYQAPKKPPDREIKFSLKALVARAKKETAVNQGAQKHMRQIEELGLARQAGDNQDLNALIHRNGPEQDMDRVMNALARTDALQQTKSWSFFNYDGFDRRKRTSIPDMPDIKDHVLAKLIKTRQQLESALLCGLLTQLAKKTRFPYKLYAWLDELGMQDRRQDIRAACRKLLTIEDGYVAQNHNDSFILDRINEMGARNEATRIEDSILPDPPTVNQPGNHDRDWSDLQYYLQLVSDSASHFTGKVAAHGVCLLVRLAIDAAVTNDAQNASLLSTALGTLIDRVEAAGDTPTLVSTLFWQTEESHFRLRILRAIPPSSPAICLLRRQLALAWFYDDPSHLQRVPYSASISDPAPLIDFDAIHAHFREHPQTFSISSTTDFSRLKTHTELLSISFGNGDPPLTTSPSNPSTIISPLDPPDSINPNRIPANATDKERKKSFDKRVDTLADAIKDIFSEIVDTGTAHATRTEAKDELERFYYRLLYAVRTRPRPKRDLLGDYLLDENNTRAGQGMMKSFLERSKRQKQENAVDGREIVEVDGDVEDGDGKRSW